MILIRVSDGPGLVEFLAFQLRPNAQRLNFQKHIRLIVYIKLILIFGGGVIEYREIFSIFTHFNATIGAQLRVFPENYQLTWVK